MDKAPKARARRSKSSPGIDRSGPPGPVPEAGHCDVPTPSPPVDGVRTDEEFRGLIPPLSADERTRLERSLLRDGCLQPLVVWAGHGILLDGHNRLELCRQHGLPFRIKEIALPDREAARAWIIEHQMARRNLTRLGESYLRGQRYRARKRQGQRSDLTSGQKNGSPVQEGDAGTSGQPVQKWTSERLAAEYQVSERTIRREALFAAAVDGLAAACGEEARRLILSRDGRLSRDDVEWWAEQPPEEQRRLLQIVRATGRLDRPRDGGPDKRWMRVPCELVALGETLLRRLNPEEIAGLNRLLTEGLQELGRDGR